MLSLLSACSPADLVVGSGEPSRSSAAGSNAGPPVLISSPAPRPTNVVTGISPDSSWLGTFEGTFEDGRGPTQITLVITYSDDAAGGTGSLTFGSGPAPPDADPALPYPPPDSELEQGLGHREQPAYGFNYTILGGHVTASGGIDFAISLDELWSDWCEMQRESAFSATERRYTCAETGSEMAEERRELCAAVCICWPGTCAVSLTAAESFQLGLDDDQVSGWSSMGDIELERVR